MDRSELADLALDLFPIARSLTGPGVRETLAVLGKHVPLEIHEVPSGTKMLDWVIPPEWTVSEAWIKDSSGKKIIDLSDSNLRVVGYSDPVHTTIGLEELNTHLHSIPGEPDAIPYRTAYYEERWGFCLTQAERDSLADDEYEVCIKSAFSEGSLTYGEAFIPGTSDEEIIISAHICHPSMANDNVSGMVVAAELAHRLAMQDQRRLGVRFIFAPATVGAIAWLAGNRDRLSKIVAGLTLVNLGDERPFTYKNTVFGDRTVDRAAQVVLGNLSDSEIIDFFPYGYDERQYNSPGFRLPVGSLMRARHGRYPEYHTSLDDLSTISAEHLEQSADIVESLLDVVDRNRRYVNAEPYGEPQLGRRRLYDFVSHGLRGNGSSLALLWVLNLSDGNHDLIDIASRSEIDFDDIAEAAAILADHDLLTVV